MVKKLLLFALGFSGLMLGQPVVSNIQVVRTTHSTVTLSYRTDVAASYTRVRYGLTTNYEAEGGCSFPDCGIQHYNWYDLNTSTNVEVRVSGLKPNTAYKFCVQASLNNSAWSTCVNQDATTDATPAGIHPAKPTTPTAVNITRPDTSGYTTRAVDADCSDLQTKINDAATNQASAGSIVTIPAGTICTGQYTLKAMSGAKTFTTGNVNTTNNRITIPSHGLSNNDLVKLVSAVPPASAGTDVFYQYRGFPSGNLYYAIVHDANTISLSETSGGAAKPFTFTTFTVTAATNVINVPSEIKVPLNETPIQFVSTTTLPNPLTAGTTYYVISRDQAARTFKVSTTLNGAEVDITDTGTGTHSIAHQGGGGSVMKWPPTSHWIVIRTATPDSQFVPEGVTVTPEFQPKMATIRTSNQNASAIIAEDYAFQYRMEGIEVTHTDTATAEISTTINPMHFVGLMWFQRTTEGVILDRCYIHGLGFPNRVTRAIVEFNGANSAIINSYWDKLDSWTPVREGMALTRNSNTQFTIGAGTFHLGAGSRSIASTVTVDLSGTASGTKVGLVYLTMGGTLTLDLPTGVNGSCSTACTIINSSTPAYPVNGSSGTTVMPIGNLNITNADLTAVSAEALEPPYHQRTWEGASSFIAGDVAGKTALINNIIRSTGLPVHYDDSIGNQSPTGTHYTITRNHFIVPQEHIWSLPGSNKLRYGQRQQLEFKNGKYIRIWGNIFEGVFADSTPIATAIAISGTPGPNAEISDVEIGYNIFRHGSGSLGLTNGRAKTDNAETRPPNRPLQRLWIHNNLLHHLNQYKYRAYAGNNSTGIGIDVRGGLSDVTIEHNTIYDNRGTTNSCFWLAQQPNETMQIKNNICFLNGDNSIFSDECGYNTPVCPGGGGKNVLDALAYNYLWENNTIIAGYTTATLESETPTPRSDKTYITNQWGGAAPITAYLQSEMAGEIDWRDVANGNFRIGNAATHKSGGSKRGSDGLDRGVDMEQLDIAIGVIKTGTANGVTATTATLVFFAPDEGAACYVAYGTGSDIATWSGRSSPNTTNARNRSIAISGLTPSTTYGYQIWCAGTKRSETRYFRTAPQT